jgi:hypothetical protein
LLYLLRASFLEQCRLAEASGGVVLINRVADDESLGGMAQRGLDDDHSMMG